MKKSTMAYVLIGSLLVVAILAALAFRAAAARKAQAEDEARATEREDRTHPHNWVTVHAGETATVSAKGIEVRPTKPEEARPD
jgi:hypothetical protein